MPTQAPRISNIGALVAWLRLRTAIVAAFICNKLKTMQAQHIAALNAKLAEASPVAVLKEACSLCPAIGLSFSGAEDVVLIDMAGKLQSPPAVFCLDTGRLHPATYEFIEQVRVFYNIEIELLTPDATTLTDFVRRKGLFSFYKDGHEECCGLRKVAPLRKKLSSLDGWITGQRQDQSPTRSNVKAVEHDEVFSSESHRLIKFNPLAYWALQDVWDYIRDNDVPYNPLHDAGYVSIGCEPCTRPPRPGEHERAGRWWWEQATQRECGLHVEPTADLIPAVNTAEDS